MTAIQNRTAVFGKLPKEGSPYKLDTSHSSDIDSQTAFLKACSVFNPDFTPTQVATLYDQWATEYECDLQPGRYNGPKYGADTLARYLVGTDTGEKRILDVAAGTGFLGHLLNLKGFRYIDALDPSEEMLKVAKSRDVYQNLIVEFFSGDPTPGIEEDTYDGLVIAGGMAEGHVPSVALWEMARCVKPGGIIVNAMRKEFLDIVQEYKNRLEPLMDEMEQKGVWRRLERTEVKDFFVGKDGVVFVHQKC